MFFYRNLLMISPSGVSNVMDVLLECLADENVEVREMSSKTLSGIVRCSQRQSIIPLKVSSEQQSSQTDSHFRNRIDLSPWLVQSNCPLDRHSIMVNRQGSCTLLSLGFVL